MNFFFWKKCHRAEKRKRRPKRFFKDENFSISERELLKTVAPCTKSHKLSAGTRNSKKTEGVTPFGAIKNKAPKKWEKGTLLLYYSFVFNVRGFGCVQN